MKIFITGSTGFIGTHLVQRLVQTEHDIVCLVRHTSRVDELERLGVTLVLGDVTDRQSVLEGMKGCDWVMNLANVYTLWERDRGTYWKVNVEGTRNVMECALQNAVKKVVHVSSAAVWGRPARMPFTEDTEPGPERTSDYARSKHEGDLIAWDLMRTKGLPLVMVYPAGVLGSGDTRYAGLYIRDLIQRRMPVLALTDTVMTFVHVKDVADAIIRAAEKKNNIGEKYIIGRHMASIREFNELISEVSRVRLPRLTIPVWLARLNAFVLTGLAGLTGKPPLWGLSRDAVSMLSEDVMADGSKAERELGITYTSLRQAIEDEIHPPKETMQPYRQRRYSRYRFSRDIMLQPENMEHTLVRLKDISRGGLFAETDRPLKEGMNVTAGFSEKMESFPVVKGRVLRKTDRGLAVQFTGGGAEHIPRLLSH
ncbi:MAG TPA: NAD-dependent epimerase/dehydratase family protein [Deltaproteobacteria bacterium]|nr:NAD-dependent epimerase/dehydratase family protein [Deltaproteobacteria bacterium]